MTRDVRTTGPRGAEPRPAPVAPGDASPRGAATRGAATNGAAGGHSFAGGPAATADLLRPGDGRPSPALVRVAAMFEMETRLTARRLENVFVTLVLPAVLLVFFGAVPVLPESALLPGAEPIDGLLPAILATAIVAAGLVNLGISTGYERSYGVLKRLGASPLTRGQLLAGKVATIAALEVVQAAVLVGLAVTLFGWSPGPDWSPAGAAAAILLGTAAFAALGLLLAGTLRAETTMALANALFLLALLLGGLLVPGDQLPGVLGALASLLPTAALADALRIALGASAGDLVGPLALVAAWAVGSGLLAARTFRWE